MKLFQINEDDLVLLERILPELQDDMMPYMTNRHRRKFRLLQKILINVRWNYGPPTDIEVIDAEK